MAAVHPAQPAADELIRDELNRRLPGIPALAADAIKDAEYLEQCCPITVGPSLLEKSGEYI